MKIVFMGTPDFAAKSLEKLIESKHEICAVITNPDKPANRGYELQMSPVKKLALDNGLEILTPLKIKNNEEIKEKLRSYDADIFVVVAYGKILPKDILDMPRLGCVNVHGSLLPKYRGAAPIQFAVINGDEKTGITTMLMDEGMDTGDMLLKEEYKILDEDTAESVFEKLSELGGNLLLETLEKLEKGEITPIKQNEEEATYCTMLSKKDGEMDFNMTTNKLFSFVRGMTPWPSAYTFLDGKMLKVLDIDKSVKDQYSDFNVGEVVKTSKDGILVKTLDGVILLTKVQLEGKKAMNADEFLRGNKIEDGKKLGR